MVLLLEYNIFVLFPPLSKGLGFCTFNCGAPRIHLSFFICTPLTKPYVVFRTILELFSDQSPSLFPLTPKQGFTVVSMTSANRRICTLDFHLAGDDTLGQRAHQVSALGFCFVGLLQHCDPLLQGMMDIWTCCDIRHDQIRQCSHDCATVTGPSRAGGLLPVTPVHVRRADRLSLSQNHPLSLLGKRWISAGC